MAAGLHTVTLIPMGADYLQSLPERTAARYLGTNCRTELQSHVGETVTITLEVKTTAPTRVRVYPYQSTGISISNSHWIDPSTTGYTEYTFVDTVKDWGGDIVTYTPGAIGVYDNNGTGGPIYVRNFRVSPGAVTDISCLVDEVNINHGRDDTTAQPDAPSCTLDISRDPDDDFVLPSTLEIGAAIHVTTETGNGTAFTRFIGTVTDISLGWEDTGADAPFSGEGQVIATGSLDQAARRVVGDTPWPQELDGARVSRIFAAAGVNLDPAFSDPGTVQILARDVDSQPALDLARDVAESASGMVWQTRDGYIRYADASHRRGVVSTLTLDACDVLITPTWRRSLEGLINSVSLGYGVAPEGSDQPRYLAANETSKGRYGTYDFSFTTQLAALADAQAMGNLLIGRNAVPVWIMAALPVDVLGLSADDYDALLSLDMHSLITLTGLPVIGTAPTSAVLWVEGWRETLAAGVHDIEIVVSGYCRTGPPPRWDDVDPGWTWDTLQPQNLTWDDATCLGPPVNFGRWNDVPASLRWDQTPPAVTWDTWDKFIGQGV